jgi:hypothetical protein
LPHAGISARPLDGRRQHIIDFDTLMGKAVKDRNLLSGKKRLGDDRPVRLSYP